MIKLSPIQQAFWDVYVSKLPKHKKPAEVFVEASFAGNKDITDELINLYLSGQKTAGSSLVADFEACGDPLPQIGNYWIILDSQEMPKCLVRTNKVVFNKFKDVPKEIAQAEGEGDLSLEYWKNTHSEFYKPFLAKWGVDNLDEAMVVTEYFDVVFP